MQQTPAIVEIFRRFGPLSKINPKITNSIEIIKKNGADRNTPIANPPIIQMKSGEITHRK